MALSITFLRRALLGTCAAGAAALAGWHHAPQVQAYLADRLAESAEGSEITGRQIVYRLDRQRATSFSFSQPVDLVRIVSRPALIPGTARAGQVWDYAFDAELLDADGTVAARYRIYSRGQFLDPAGKPLVPRNFFRGRPETSGTFDEVLIEAPRPVARLRLTEAVLPEGLVGIDVRVNEQRPFLAADPQAAFQRLNPESQQRLARANAFPVPFLTPQERANIAINQWRPIGPTGIESQDYTLLVRYIAARPGIEEEDGE